MSMHAKTDSEVTSLAPSSPTRSPRRPAIYYVQSPSRDSHDGEKTTNSFHSTPVLSPMGSPGHHSRDSSSTRFSGSLKPGSRKAGERSHHRKRTEKEWNEFDAIEEEGLLDDDMKPEGVPRLYIYFLAFIVGFVVLFTFFSLILWGASRNQKPIITMKSIAFAEFSIQAGSDFTGVATVMVTMNSTVNFLFRNTGTFFGIHVESTLIDLSYSQLPLATGTVKKFYQERKSERQIKVILQGSSIPLYGAGANLSSKDGVATAPVPLNLNFVVRAKGYVLGKLVKPKFSRRVHCQVVMDPNKMNVAILLKNSCTFQ